MIRAYADGEVIETFDKHTNTWVVIKFPAFYYDSQYRVQPAKIEMEYTKTTLNCNDLRMKYVEGADCYGEDSFIRGLERIANYAIQHFIENDLDKYLQEQSK